MVQRMNWARAKKARALTDADHRAQRLDRKADTILARAPLPKPPVQKTQDQRPKRHHRKHGTTQAAKFHWPIFITIGPHPLIQGALHTITINSRLEADRCGYAWAGR